MWTTSKRFKFDIGSAALTFMVVLLPLILMFLLLAFDAKNFFTDRLRNQQILDEAALIAARYLPSDDSVDEAVKHYLNEFNQELASAAVIKNYNSLGRGKIELNASLPIHSVLAEYIGLEKKFKYTIASSVKLLPRKVVLFLDSSSYLGPRRDDDLDLWGQENWPAAKFYAKSGLEEDEARWLTKQCFNPAFSSIKQAAINILDFVSAFSNNEFGLLMGPDFDKGVSVVHELGPITGASTGVFDFYESGKVSDRNCLRLTESEPERSGYKVPPVSNRLLETSFHNEFNNFKKPNNLSLRRLIWTRAVRQEEADQGPRIVNISSVISQVGNSLLGSFLADSQAVQLERAIALVFFGDLPYQDGVRFPDTRVNNAMESKLLSLNKKLKRVNRKAGIYFITTRHQGNYPGCSAVKDKVELVGCNDFIEDGRDFENFLEGINTKTKNLELIFVRVPDTASMAQDLLALLPLALQGRLVNA